MKLLEKRITDKIKKLNFRTLYFNFRYFPFSTAVKLPVFISRRSCFYNLKGRIILEGKVKTGMIELGYGDVPIFDKKFSRFIWDVKGTVTFEKNCSYGHGTKIRVLERGELYIGENSVCTAESAFIAKKRVIIKKNTLISWDVLIMDTDFHYVYDESGKIINPDREIIIGENVWIGCRCTILKGAVIGDHSIIAANTVVPGALAEAGAVYAGSPYPRIIGYDTAWKL